jgi:hypothetical protein
VLALRFNPLSICVTTLLEPVLDICMGTADFAACRVAGLVAGAAGLPEGLAAAATVDGAAWSGGTCAGAGRSAARSDQDESRNE